MNPTTTSDTDYQQLFSQLIKKQMIVLGPDITLAKVSNVTGLVVDNRGDVQRIDGDPQVLLQGLISQFVELSGLIVRKTMESILTSYPGMMAMAATGMLGGIQVQSQPQSQTQQASSSDPAKTLAVKPEDLTQTQVQAAISQSVTVRPTDQGVRSEPPLMPEVKLASLNHPIANQKESTFSNNEMSELNKALDKLSNAAALTEQVQSK